MFRFCQIYDYYYYYLNSYPVHTPLLLTQGAPVVLLHPETHAAVVEGVVALAPNNHALVLLVLALAPKTGVCNREPCEIAYALQLCVVYMYIKPFEIAYAISNS